MAKEDIPLIENSKAILTVSSRGSPTSIATKSLNANEKKKAMTKRRTILTSKTTSTLNSIAKATLSETATETSIATETATEIATAIAIAI